MILDLSTVWIKYYILWLCLQGPQGPQGVQGDKGPQGEGFPGPKVLFYQSTHQNNSDIVEAKTRSYHNT